MTAEGSISLPDSSHMEDWVFLNSLAWVDTSVPDHALKMILKAALPIIAKNYFTNQPILEAVIDSSVEESRNTSADYSYFFVKAVIGETFCPATKNIDRNANKKCFKQNMEGSLKLCAIHMYYNPRTNKFKKNIIKCWEMNDFYTKDDYYADKAMDATQTLINQQVQHYDYSSFYVKNLDRIYHLDLKTPEIWYDKIFYLKFQVQHCLEPHDGKCTPPDDESEILTCSGEIDVSSKYPDLYKEYMFQCE